MNYPNINSQVVLTPEQYTEWMNTLPPEYYSYYCHPSVYYDWYYQNVYYQNAYQNNNPQLKPQKKSRNQKRK